MTRRMMILVDLEKAILEGCDGRMGLRRRWRLRYGCLSVCLSACPGSLDVVGGEGCLVKQGGVM